MPYYSRPARRHTDQRHVQLVNALVAELKSGPTTCPAGEPDPAFDPIIIEEPVPPGPSVNVYVIWIEWGTVTEEHRSAAILDAYKDAKGQDAMLNISIAMGLTPTEADRLGIKP